MSRAERHLAMLLSPPGSAAIAVVRISGERVAGFLERHFSKSPAPSRCTHGELRDGDAVIDDPVVILADDGRTAEIHLHGGPWVVAATLDLLRRGGFDVIEPPAGAPLDVQQVDGETLLEREVLACLPLARTEQGIRLLLGQVQAWRSFLRESPEAPALQRIGDLRPMLVPPRVAIVGRPNVGKSTLANQLFAQQRSLTADLPGTTRDWVGELANLEGLAVILVDTPGRRETDDAIERAAIARSGEVIGAADLVIEVIDAAAGHADASNVDASNAAPMRPDAIIVLNKVDRAAARSAVRHDLETVATTGQGVDALRRAIRAHFGFADFDPARPGTWTVRHKQILASARRDPAALQEMLG